MTAPDFISPMIGYRVWQWDAAGLKSLNGVAWRPGVVFTAQCKTQGCRQAPQSNCTCGVYAAKTLDHLRWTGYTQHGIHGEVCLWGTVVEHQAGWRSQFAYPKKFIVPLSMVPLGMSKVESWLASLAEYGCDIFVQGETGTVPLWRKDCGVDANGIGLLVRRCNAWYAKRAEQRRIKRGDRVAVLGHGIAVVEHADNDQVQAVIGNRDVLRIMRGEVVWCEQNNRWETAVSARIGMTGRRA